MAAASSSANCPVPSGELSSTTKTSIRGSWWRMAGTTRGKLILSLYVGTTTSRRSATSPTAYQDGTGERQNKHAHPGCRRHDGGQTHDLRPVSHQDAVIATAGERHRHQRVVYPEDRDRGAIDLGLPGRVIGTTHSQQRRPAGPNPNGQGIIAVPLDCSGSGPSRLPDRGDRLLHDGGLCRIEGRRP